MNKHKDEKILLIGGLDSARSLAASLLSQGYCVTAINDRLTDCQTLAEIKGLNVYHGDGTKPYALDEAGAAECSTAIALTGEDADNLVACQLCKRKFGVHKTVAIVSDPEKTDFFRQMGVDSVVCAISAVTSIIQQQAFIDEMVSVLPVGQGRAQIVEVHIPRSAPSAGKKLWEIELPKEVIIGCILRGDQTIIPRGDTRVHEDDTLVVISASGQDLAAVHALTGR